MNNLMLAAWSLWRREMVRFYRDRSRVIGGLVPPIIFWFFIGSGLSGSFSMGSGETALNYRQYFFPGTLVLIFLFTAVFSTISIIEDRREGFLQSVLVAPVPRLAIVLGKLFGSASLAFLQGMPFLVAAPFIGLHLTVSSLIISLFILFGVAFSLAGVGFLIAWRLDSTQGFHAIMNMGLIPLWLLSGALFPIHNIPGWLSLVVRLNPLTYCVAALQHELFVPGAIPDLPPLWFCVSVIAVFSSAILFAAVFITRRGRDQ